MPNGPDGERSGGNERPADVYGEEVRSVITRAKHEADEILAKARALLSEAKSFRGSLSLSYEEYRAEARRIGFSEGFRLGRQEGEDLAFTQATLQSIGKESPEAVAHLERAVGRLREDRSRFEAEKLEVIEALRRIVEGAASEEDLAGALVRFLKEHPPTLALEAYMDGAASAADRDSRSRRKESVAGPVGVRATDRQ